MGMPKRVAIFVSGTGSLLEAMIPQKDELGIVLVLADRPCRGLEIARAAGIETELAERTDFNPKRFDAERDAYTLRILQILIGCQIDLVAMAGFMTILHRVIFERGFKGRILNTHPALLPMFKGNHVVLDAILAGVKVTGCTVHVATEVRDEGPILAQKAVDVLPNDTVETLWERIKVVERVLYPKTILEYAATLK